MHGRPQDHPAEPPQSNKIGTTAASSAGVSIRWWAAKPVRNTAAMAVTQQLARVTTEYLNFCRQAAEVSPDANPHWDPPRADRIDLDWSPEPLRRLLQLARFGPAAVAALERSTNGDALIDVSCLDHDDAVGTFGPPPRAVSPPR